MNENPAGRRLIYILLIPTVFVILPLTLTLYSWYAQVSLVTPVTDAVASAWPGVTGNDAGGGEGEIFLEPDGTPTHLVLDKERSPESSRVVALLTALLEASGMKVETVGDQRPGG